jgi:hypothetical protein
MTDREATRNDDVPGNVLTLLGEDCLKQITQLISNICETGEDYDSSEK